MSPNLFMEGPGTVYHVQSAPRRQLSLQPAEASESSYSKDYESSLCFTP